MTRTGHIITCQCGKQLNSAGMNNHAKGCRKWQEHVAAMVTCRADVEAEVQKVGLAEVGRKYGVSDTTVMRIVRGESIVSLRQMNQTETNKAQTRELTAVIAELEKIAAEHEKAAAVLREGIKVLEAA